MPKITVYRVKMYDAQSDQEVISSRMATREGAARMCGSIIEESATEIDTSQLETGAPWTPRGFAS